MQKRSILRPLVLCSFLIFIFTIPSPNAYSGLFDLFNKNLPAHNTSLQKNEKGGVRPDKPEPPAAPVVAPNINLDSISKLIILPEVISVSPPNNVTAGIGELIQIRFSKKMDINSLRDSISMKGFFLVSNNIPIQIQASDETQKNFTLVPEEALVPKVAYSVDINKEATKDLEGATLKEDYKWSFFTDEHPCVPPELTIHFTRASCQFHAADACDKVVFEGDCDEQWADGQTVITAGDYALSWTSKNTSWVEDDLGRPTQLHHNYVKDTNFEGDSGEISFGWDKQVFNKWKGVEHWMAVPGTQYKSITAHGSCGQVVTVNYQYSCP